MNIKWYDDKNVNFQVELFGDIPIFTNVSTVADAATPRSLKLEVLLLSKDDLTIALQIYQNVPMPK